MIGWLIELNAAAMASTLIESVTGGDWAWTTLSDDSGVGTAFADLALPLFLAILINENTSWPLQCLLPRNRKKNDMFKGSQLITLSFLVNDKPLLLHNTR